MASGRIQTDQGGRIYLFLGLWVYIIIDGSLANTDLFLLWIFTTCGFWGEMCSVINSLDASANLATEYVLKDD